MDFTTAVSQVIRRRRLENGLPQRELAFLCGLDPMTISRIERGGYPPSLSTFWLLAKALRSSPAELAAEIDSLTNEPQLVEAPPPAGYRKAVPYPKPVKATKPARSTKAPIKKKVK